MNTNPNADTFHEKRDAEAVAEAERVAKTTRADCRELARLLRFDADNMDDPDAALRVIRAAELLETSDWFNVEELLTVAEAMRANGYTVADGFTMRRRLDDWHLIRADLRPTFAAYLRDIPNGGAK